MSRSNGFLNADIDTGLLSDPKLRAARKRMGPDPEGAKTLVLAYLSVILSSWREGDRQTLTEALPEWMEDVPGVAEALVAEGLLDKSMRIPVKVWQGWFGVADARRQQRREAGRAGGLAKAERGSGDATTADKRDSSDALPNRPTVQPTNQQTNSPSPPTRASAREDGGSVEPFGDVMNRMGFKPPEGR